MITTDIEGWNVKRVDWKEYNHIVTDRKIFFNEPAFCELNKNKVEEVYYLIIRKENSARFGLIVGREKEYAKIPFSAPYSYPVEIKAKAKMESFDLAVCVMEEYWLKEGIKKVSFTFPPLFYDEHILSAWVNSFYRRNYKIVKIDINYSLNLEKLNTISYNQFISEKGRKHLKKAINSGIKIYQCESKEDIARAYQIIYINHNIKKRPTRLSLEELYQIFEIVPYKVFIADYNNTSIAAMIYYQINQKIVQCIYSGCIPGYENSGVMNYLSFYAVQYFGKLGYQFIDRAIATEEGIPNYGLCDFKESIGGERSLKYSFYKEL